MNQLPGNHIEQIAQPAPTPINNSINAIHPIAIPPIIQNQQNVITPPIGINSPEGMIDPSKLIILIIIFSIIIYYRTS